MSSVVIINPAAADRTGGVHERRLRPLVREYLPHYDIRVTRHSGEATELARAALRQGARHLVVAGGDGTVNEVVNGFFDRQGSINPHAILSIVPVGVGNDLLRSLGCRGSLEKHFRVAAGLEGVVRAIDVGKVEYRDERGNPASRYFINTADFGLTADVQDWFNRNRCSWLGGLMYLVGTLAVWRHRRAFRIEATIGDRHIEIDDVLFGVVCNGTTFGKGMRIAPRAQLDDGLLDIYLVRQMGVASLCKRIAKAYRGIHQEDADVHYVRGSALSVRVARGMRILIAMDGEQTGMLPAVYSVVPSALKVRV